MIHARGLFSRNSAENGKDSYGMLDLAAWREIHHADFLFSQRRKERKGIPTECWTWRLGERFITQIFCSRKGAKNAKKFLRNAGLGGLEAWREMVHVDFLFSQRRGGRKGIPTECWTWRLGGLARDINDPRTRIIFSQRRGGRKGFQLDNRLSEKNNKANLIYRHNN